MKKFRNKIMLITGATGGIGKETALMLAKENAVILAVGRNKKRLVSLKNTIIASGGLCHIYNIDLSQPKKIKNLCQKIKKEFKSIDWIIHSAGYIASSEHITKTFNVNLFSFIELVNLFNRNIKRGAIAISSTAGIWGNQKYPVYSASKGALNVYCQSLARQFSQKKLSSISICPGPTNTPMREKIAHDALSHQSPKIIASVIKKIISGKSNYKNGDIIIARDKKTKIHQRL